MYATRSSRKVAKPVVDPLARRQRGYRERPASGLSFGVIHPGLPSVVNGGRSRSTGRQQTRRATQMASTARVGTGFGIVQIYALVFGIAYLAVAVLEVVCGSSGLKIGGVTILQVRLVQHLIHWVVGLAVLGSFLAGEKWAKMVARIVGVVFVLVS